MTSMRAVMIVVLLAGCGDNYDAPYYIKNDAAPPGDPIDAAECFLPLLSLCSPLTQMGCELGDRCTWIQLRDEDGGFEQLGRIGCAPIGSKRLDETCSYTPSPRCDDLRADDCGRGLVCADGRCKSICDHQGGQPQCDDDHACARYESLFESGDYTVAGACDPKCDPLTQARVAGEVRAACGSPDPAAPDHGCFTQNGIDFTCGPVTPEHLVLTDRMPARGPASGGAYTNGCAPGFLPLFREMTGSNVVACAGLCAPLPTDTTLAGNVAGDASAIAKLPTEAAPAAGNAVCTEGTKGSEPGQGCLFLSVFNTIDHGAPVAGDHDETVGVCFAPSHFTYDHDFDPGTPDRAVPSCADLPPHADPPAGCVCDAGGTCGGAGCPDGLAHEWGCYPTADTPPSSINAALRDFRPSYQRARNSLRHRFR
jgi:hypothetical protein